MTDNLEANNVQRITVISVSILDPSVAIKYVPLTNNFLVSTFEEINLRYRCTVICCALVVNLKTQKRPSLK